MFFYKSQMQSPLEFIFIFTAAGVQCCMVAVNSLLKLHHSADYCKTLNICGIKFCRFNKNNILAYFNFGGHDIPWLQIVKKI